MQAARKAKLFRNGASQAVRLPADFRFDGEEVYISRDEKTQDVILSTSPETRGWQEFLASRRPELVPEDWMKDRPLNQISPERPPLFGEDE